MPKMKTHKGSRKRFRVSANGKLIRRQAGKRHLQSHKAGTRRQRLHGIVVKTDKVAKKLIRAMGGHS